MYSNTKVTRDKKNYIEHESNLQIMLDLRLLWQCSRSISLPPDYSQEDSLIFRFLSSVPSCHDIYVTAASMKLRLKEGLKFLFTESFLTCVEQKLAKAKIYLNFTIQCKNKNLHSWKCLH
jgi:hypothetical protein